MFDDIITLAEAAELLGLSPSTLRNQAVNGRLRARLIGKTWVTTKEEVERYGRVSAGRSGRPYLYLEHETGWGFTYRFDNNVPSGSDRQHEAQEVLPGVMDGQRDGAVILAGLTTALAAHDFYLADVEFHPEDRHISASIGDSRLLEP